MEIPAWMYFSFWAIIGVISLYLGMEALNNTDLSPKILFLLKLFLTTPACHSSTHALVFRTKMKIHAQTYYLWFAFAVFPIGFAGIVAESFAWYFPIYSLMNISVMVFYFLPWNQRFVGPIFLYIQSIVFALIPLLYFLSPGDSFGWYFSIFISNLVVIFHIHFAAIEEEQFALLFHYYIMSVLFMLCWGTHYLTFTVLFSTSFTVAAHAAISGDERLQRWLRGAAVEENRIFSKLKKMMGKKGRVIEFLIGMGGAMLFQKLCPLTSLDDVAVFLLLAVSWLANLALLHCHHDLGIFNFLLGNVVVGCCNVGQFGLRSSSWIMLGASVFVYILRSKVELIWVVDRGEEKASVVAWLSSEVHAASSSIV